MSHFYAHLDNFNPYCTNKYKKNLLNEERISYPFQEPNDGLKYMD